MIIDEYKKKFSDLFKEIEKEHGKCESVKVYHGEEIKDSYGRTCAENIIVEIHF